MGRPNINRGSDQSKTSNAGSQDSKSAGRTSIFRDLCGEATMDIVNKIKESAAPYIKKDKTDRFQNVVDRQVKPLIEKKLGKVEEEYNKLYDEYVDDLIIVKNCIDQTKSLNEELKAENEKLKAEIKELKAKNEELDKRNKALARSAMVGLSKLYAQSETMFKEIEALHTMLQEPLYSDLLRALIHFADCRDQASFDALSGRLRLQYEIIRTGRDGLDIQKLRSMPNKNDVLRELKEIKEQASQLELPEEADPELIQRGKAFKEEINIHQIGVRKRYSSWQKAALFIALSDEGILASFDSEAPTIDEEWCIGIGKRIRKCMTDCEFELLRPDEAYQLNGRRGFIKRQYNLSGLYARDDQNNPILICPGFVALR